ncbi:MAG: FGGY-family carbohydrate kinase [Deltaproteobacteria bacterium]|nr:MAG: FGGY-family carbohydrate kinase [Deltaproteobacteria bacterium]
MPEKTGGEKYILAIDHGTSGVKVALMSTRGVLAGFEYEKTPIYFLPDGGAEQDPGDWERALVNASRRLMAQGLVPVDRIAAVCCSSTFSSTVAVDEGGNHLMNSLTWMDSRGAPYIKEVVKGFPSIEGYGLFNILPWIRRTGGGPQLSGKDDIAHVLLIKYEYPEVYGKTHMFLGSKDYLNLRLTGKFAASYDSMTLFWVTNTRDIKNIYYDDSLIGKLKIDRSKLPPMRSSIGVLGTISPEMADKIGLNKEVKVVMGSPDHQSAGIGSGAVRDFEGHIYIGTSSWIQCVVPFKKTDMFHSIASLPTSIPGKYYCANEQDIAGGCLAFLVDNIIYHKNKLNQGDPPDEVYEYLDEIAAGVPAGSGRLIFTPWLNGERTPVDDTTVRGGIHNLKMTTTTDHIVRAFFEGVAYNCRWALKYIEKFTGRRMDPLNIVGGGANSEVWCQIFADVLNRTIRQVQDPMQTNTRGAAFIASVALGCITFEEIPGLIEYSKILEPDPKNREIYDELYGEFLQIYKNNKAMYRRLNRVR